MFVSHAKDDGKPSKGIQQWDDQIFILRRSVAAAGCCVERRQGGSERDSGRLVEDGLWAGLGWGRGRREP